MTREEQWLSGIASALDGEGTLPEVPPVPAWHQEEMLAAIYDAATDAASPRPFPARRWHLDEVLYAVYCAVAGLEDPGCPEPTCRLEAFWHGVYCALLGDEDTEVPVPAWRKEEFLKAVYEGAAEWGAGVTTLTGALVSFLGKASSRITDVTVVISPIQSGGGTPAPDNVRPITGWTGAEIYVSPTQDKNDGTTYTETWSSQAGTVYGGTLNVLTGVLTVDRVMLDPTAWTQYASGNGFIAYSISDCPPIRETYEASTLMSNMVDEFGSFSSSNMTKNVIQPPQSYLNTAYMALQSDVDGHTVQFSYLLATPVEYQLTPQQITALVGTNNVWSNAGAVTVTVKGTTTA